ncbi:hypothetical protein EFY79_01835 [Hanamia caeni]|uniref:RiboL-PSP-HEPN domain-containing protein n=1 Tax=Hanamia caeni TaxID=2294116 RepID=A0A3M9NQL1_9BACT|nr:hypothetical protein [Hanamia caeni]RNI40066.1 hypothetical protein EFY79_01835 [Hanamia caeni]
MRTLSQNLDELFLDTVLELTELSSFKTSTEAGYELMEKKYKERYQALLDNLSNSGKRTFLDLIRIKLSVTQDGLHNLEGKKEQFIYRINKSLIIHACSVFDYFLNQTLFLILSNNPQLLSNEKRTIQYHELVKYSKEELIQSTIERFIHELSYKSISERIRQMNSMFNLELDFTEIQQPDIFFSSNINLIELTEIFSIRNIIIHNQGIVNKLFVDNNTSSKYKVGDQINLDSDRIEKYTLGLSKYASSISRQTMMNFH